MFECFTSPLHFFLQALQYILVPMNLNGAFRLPRLSTFFFFVVSLNINGINGGCL